MGLKGKLAASKMVAEEVLVKCLLAERSSLSEKEGCRSVGCERELAGAPDFCKSELIWQVEHCVCR